MNNKVEAFKKYMKRKKIAVLGIGVSNTPLIKYLSTMDVEITAFDKNNEDKLKSVLADLKGLDVKYCLGADYLSNLKGFDMIFRSPGIRFDIPELIAERERGAEITSEMEVFFDLCPADIIAVTGSDGKTTTTSLIYNILKEAGYTCWLGGNIGFPLLSRIEEIEEDHKVVLELSSFQLHTMKKSPQVAVITNISPNHLDVHKSYEEYIDAKKNIFRFQNEECEHIKDKGTECELIKDKRINSKLILNYDNEITRSFANEARGEVVFFSRVNPLDNGAICRAGELLYKEDGKETSLVRAEEIVLPGNHNIENYLAASAAVIDYVSPEAIRRVAASFIGVEHRMEFVREINGIKFYNSSIDSSPSRTIAALSIFNQKVILIAGGKDKGIDYDPIGEVIANKVKTLILTGPTAAKIEKALENVKVKTGSGNDVAIIKCTTYEEAVKAAYNRASEGDIVILSPASTSFDMFKNFEERGNKFKELVNKL